MPFSSLNFLAVAAAALLALALTPLVRLLARRIGMVHEKRVAGYAVGDGRFEDVDIFAMTSAEYFDLPY